MSHTQSDTKKEVPKEDEKSVDNDNEEGFCPKCSKSVKTADSAVCCEICDLWYHIKCVNISDVEYNFIADHKSLHWYCESCNRSVANVIKLVTVLKATQEKIVIDVKKIENNLSSIEVKVNTNKDKIDSTFVELAALKQQVLEQSTAIAELNTLKVQVQEQSSKLEVAIEAKLVEKIEKNLQPTFASIAASQVESKFDNFARDVTVVKQTLAEVKKSSSDERDRESRSHNIIMYRIKEEENNDERVKADKAFVIKLINEALQIEAKENDIKSIFRIGKRDISHPGEIMRPLLVQFREKTCKNQVMESLFKLKNADPLFKNVSITHDLSKEDREECKKLINEAKTREVSGEFVWRVRGLPGQMKIVKLRKS